MGRKILTVLAAVVLGVTAWAESSAGAGRETKRIVEVGAGVAHIFDVDRDYNWHDTKHDTFDADILAYWETFENFYMGPRMNYQNAIQKSDDVWSVVLGGRYYFENISFRPFIELDLGWDFIHNDNGWLLGGIVGVQPWDHFNIGITGGASDKNYGGDTSLGVRAAYQF